MKSASELLDTQYHEMRWRILSLAADFDRIQRASGGSALARDQRFSALRQCLAVVAAEDPDRAERVQMLLSDLSPAPAR